MTKTIALDLGRAGVVHMKKWFQGWKETLAEYAVVHLDKFQHCLAFVPEGTTLEEAEQYDTGRYWRGCRLAVYKYLMETHLHHPEYSLIVMDYCLETSDPDITTYDHTFFYKKQIYSYLNSEKFTEASVEDTLHTAAFHSIGFIIEGSIDEVLYEKRFVPTEVFENLAANIKMISLSAYDGESYLLAY